MPTHTHTHTHTHTDIHTYTYMYKLDKYAYIHAVWYMHGRTSAGIHTDTRDIRAHTVEAGAGDATAETP
jgi:hypothetical protein